ncbi:MAG: response regulator transcription factor [Verrucomicrobiae bacterium]|nr:response regulator transcription factor [Verrucomicrobiae bacterium]
MKCLVIDDDPLACEIIEGFLARLGGVEYCLKLGDGAIALHIIAAEDFDVVFLDLDLPGVDGVSLLLSLPTRVPVVIVSASPDFGAKSYEFGIIDYLLKPFDFPRFAKAMGRVTAAAATRQPVTSPADGVIFLREGGKIQRIDLNEVECVRAQSNYVSFVLDGGQRIMSLVSMAKLEEILPHDFVRIHRSYIVNRNRIARIEGNKAIVGELSLPIGDSFRSRLLERLSVIKMPTRRGD